MLVQICEHAAEEYESGSYKDRVLSQTQAVNILFYLEGVD
jgi:hypothetical protein